jgi:hypothetical protein
MTKGTCRLANIPTAITPTAQAADPLSRACKASSHGCGGKEGREGRWPRIVNLLSTAAETLTIIGSASVGRVGTCTDITVNTL